MNITPITKKYTTQYNTSLVSFGNKGGVNQNGKNIFSCENTIVRNTLNEFSNSRGNYLVDIDLTDIYISGTKNKNDDNKNNNQKTTSVKNTFKSDYSNIQFLADMPLCDAYELPKSKKQNNNLQIPFGGAYPQYLIDQDAVEQYETTSYGIQDIAKSTYCSFGSAPENKMITKLVNFVKKVLPL